MTELRYTDFFGAVRLSIQAGPGFRSYPPLRGAPLSKYETVEVGFIFNRQLTKPSAAGVIGFDYLFDDGDYPVAGYVPSATLDDIRAALIG